MVTYKRRQILIDNISLLRKSFEITKQYYPQNITLSMQKRSEKGIWQRRYYDHIIRNENDLYKHIDYIHYNSMKHYQIASKDWKYSSFRKFVKLGYYDADWCNFEDKHCINSMNCE